MLEVPPSAGFGVSREPEPQAVPEPKLLSKKQSPCDACSVISPFLFSPNIRAKEIQVDVVKVRGLSKIWEYKLPMNK